VGASLELAGFESQQQAQPSSRPASARPVNVIAPRVWPGTTTFRKNV